ncbi:hypothetical protein MXB_1621, partial [Myxobolus squamalis]
MPTQLDENQALVFIYNISPLVRSSDLRIVFYEFIEGSRFVCFHYRHRSCTEDILKLYKMSLNFYPGSKFCFLIIKKIEAKSFISQFNRLEVAKLKIRVISMDEIYSEMDCQNRLEFFNNPEFGPPSYLPHGNVGTCASLIYDLISQCKIPTSVLKSLKFDVKPSFSTVPFSYEIIGEKILTKFSPQSSDCEDWERHIQLHNDVDSQQRTSERTYECEKEVVWEKGSSGLVYYTDALYWNEKEGKNVFDEDTVDDWDIDMSIYTDPANADKDAHDLLLMREVEAARKGKNIHYNIPKIYKRKHKVKHETSHADFDNFTKGFGGKQLAKYGWVKGKPIGKSGLIEPLEDSSRNPHDKTGLGYFRRQPKILYAQAKDE